MTLVSFVCEKNYFYFLIFWILEISVAIIKNLYYDKFKYLELESNLQNEFIYLGCLDVSDLLAGFLVIYTIYSIPKSRNKKLQKKNSKGEIELIYNNPKDINNNKWLLLLLISILDLLSRSVYFLFFLIIKNEPILDRFQMDWIVAIDILMRYLFSCKILKTKFYRHHFYSIIITIIGFLFKSHLDFLTIIGNKDEFLTKIWYLLFILPRALLFPLEDAINKILLSDDFLLPHSLMFYRGIIEFPIILIVGLILFKTNKLEMIYDSKNIIYIVPIKIAQTIVLSAKAFCLMQTIYIYSSQYVSFLVVAESVGGVLNFFINIIYGNDNPKIYKNIIFIIAEIISVFIMIFGTLMYNEMIIINKCGLQENTNKGLHIKEKNENLANDEESDEEEDNNGENDDNKNICLALSNFDENKL